MELLGLSNCDTCRKARKSLEAAGFAVVFRDVRAEPLSGAEIDALLAVHGDDLLNRRSTTWRGLSETEREKAAAELLSRHPALMKRPVIRSGGDSYLGWTPQIRASLGVA